MPSNHTNYISFSILFLHRDRFLSNLKPHSDVFHDTNDDAQGEPDTIKQLFEVAQQIGGILNALDASGAPVMSPYSGFSVFVAAHINMYGTIAPQRYPGGLKRAEEEKSRNLDYLERLSKLWPVGRSWVGISTTYLAKHRQLTMTSGERSKKQIDSMKWSRVTKPIPRLGCTVLGDSPSRVPWMNMVISDLVRVETRMRLGHEPLNPAIHTALISVEGLRRRPVLVVNLDFLLERILRLVVIMILKLICFNGRLLMGRGPLGLIRGWMGCGLTRGCLIQIRLLGDTLFVYWSRYTARALLYGLPKYNQYLDIILSSKIYPHSKYISSRFCPFFAP